MVLATGALVISAIVAVVVLGGDDTGSAVGEAGLPRGSAYRSLLVVASDPETVLLGTHDGLFASRDDGASWEKTALEERDAINLVLGNEGLIWTAGHELLARSTDGGETWKSVSPDGLPHLDIHGWAVNPREPETLWAALSGATGAGFYRSTDGGRSFSFVTHQVGAGVTALAVTPQGRILAGDTSGLRASTDEGKSWRTILQADVRGIAVNPDDPGRIVVTGPGILLSTDAAESWRRVLPIEKRVGPVAWSPSDPRLAYAVGLNHMLYRSTDGGSTWTPERK